MPSSYDPNARRDTPLAIALRERIRRHGAMPVAEYVRACLMDEAHGYYRTRTAIGRDGDFITAPEISQIFGELVGLWSAAVWQQMGSPARIELVEIGPGRGTMMQDALRAARRVPGFSGALSVHLVEPSVVLREAQAICLRDAGVAVTWHGSVAALATGGGGMRGPAIFLANELLDAMPIEQHVFRAGRWLRRCVGLDDDDRLIVVEMHDPLSSDPTGRPPPLDGDVAERICGLDELVRSLASAPAAAPMAALLIDYGHAEPGYGETLQAVRAHAFEHFLTSPGEADLSAQVDFAAVAACFEACAGLSVDGPVTQAEFLGALGIMQRAARLMSANSAQAHVIETGVARLMSPTGMGVRFKALGVRSSGLPALPGLTAEPATWIGPRVG